jgi:hypothetical protein
MPADRAYVIGRCLLNSALTCWQKEDHDAAGVIGVGFARN